MSAFRSISKICGNSGWIIAGSPSVESAINEEVNSTAGLVGGEKKVENIVKEAKISSNNFVSKNNIADSSSHILNLLHKSQNNKSQQNGGGESKRRQYHTLNDTILLIMKLNSTFLFMYYVS